MADNKLAAGRKMLMEFQKKKTEKQHVQSSNNNEPNIIEPPLTNESTITATKQSMVQNFIQPNAHTPEQFFDKFPMQNSSQQINASKHDDIPLAGSLFSSQSIDGNYFDLNSSTGLNNEHSKTVSNNFASNEEVGTLQQNHNNNMGNTNEQEEVQDIRSLVEISKLQQQLEFHVKTVEFLVTEKNNLMDNVQENEKTINDLKTQITDLTGRLNTSRHRVSHLESECHQMKQKDETRENQIAKLTKEMTNFHSVENAYKKQLKDVEEELQEMKTLMDDKVSDYKMLLKKYEEANSNLQSNELRLQQIIQGNSNTPQNSSLQEHCQNLEQIINTLRQQLSHMEFEKNNSSLHYQQYVEQLNNQLQILNDKQEELIVENEKLQNRETSLLQQMNSLEKQLQNTFVQNIPNKTRETQNSQDSEKLQSLQHEILQLKSEIENYKSLIESSSKELVDKQQEIEELTSNLQRIQSESPDVTKLNAAIESDRLAAQKATSQNAKMKEDLQHLEKAFEQMAHSKLELAELLQVEKNSSKSLTMKLVETEEKLKNVELKIMAKDEEMIRLQAASSELEKEILKHAQITDRINHYEAQGKSLEMIQTELQMAKNTIQILTNENDKLKKLGIQSVNPDDSNMHSEESEMLLSINDINGKHNANPENEIIQHIPTTDAMIKLEEKFTKLMKEVADLSEEKQKLEHIVLQLQGETETICEYITLYQKQRNLLKQKEMERNAQLNMLSTERENMKKQLEDVKNLVGKLKTENNSDANAKESSTIIPKIIDLLAEIKSNHLVEPNSTCSNFENFHHCPWCSGKLITV